MEKIRMIKVLQASVVAIFLLMSILGVIVFLFTPDKLDAYGKLVGIVLPFFMAEVIPAFLGTPLKNAVAALASKKEKDIVGED